MRRVLVSFLLYGVAAVATPITNVTLVGFATNVVASPFTLSVYGKDVPAMCIDFSHTASAGETWSAYLSVDGLDYTHTYHPAKGLQYEEEAYIFSQITKPGISAQNQKDLQEAAWAILNPNYYGAETSYAPDSAALGYVRDAQTNYRSIPFTDFMMVSSVNSLRQEFLIPLTTPEPASYSLLWAGLAAFALALTLRFFRSQKV